MVASRVENEKGVKKDLSAKAERIHKKISEKAVFTGGKWAF